MKEGIGLWVYIFNLVLLVDWFVCEQDGPGWVSMKYFGELGLSTRKKPYYGHLCTQILFPLACATCVSVDMLLN